MPMSKFSTLDYLFNSYYSGKKEAEIIRFSVNNSLNNMIDDQIGFEPSQSCIDAILSYAAQNEVLKSKNAGNIELNLN